MLADELISNRDSLEHDFSCNFGSNNTSMLHFDEATKEFLAQKPVYHSILSKINNRMNLLGCALAHGDTAYLYLHRGDVDAIGWLRMEIIYSKHGYSEEEIHHSDPCKVQLDSTMFFVFDMGYN